MVAAFPCGYRLDGDAQVRGNGLQGYRLRLSPRPQRVPECSSRTMTVFFMALFSSHGHPFWRKKRRGHLPRSSEGLASLWTNMNRSRARWGALPLVRSSKSLASFPKNESCDNAKLVYVSVFSVVSISPHILVRCTAHLMRHIEPSATTQTLAKMTMKREQISQRSFFVPKPPLSGGLRGEKCPHSLL